MTRAERRLERAVWVTPASQRSRYEHEWRGDLAAAAQQGLDEDGVSRGAMGMAVRLRVREIERLLLGGRGLVAAVLAWAVLLVVLVAAFLLGNVVLVGAVLLVGAVGVVLARAGTPSHWSHWLMVASVLVMATSVAFVWWVAGVKIEAADSGTPEPPIAAWGGTALLLLAASLVAFVGSAIFAARRERHRARR
jgi:hypothetical protein